MTSSRKRDPDTIIRMYETLDVRHYVDQVLDYDPRRSTHTEKVRYANLLQEFNDVAHYSLTRQVSIEESKRMRGGDSDSSSSEENSTDTSSSEEEDEESESDTTSSEEEEDEEEEASADQTDSSDSSKD